MRLSLKSISALAELPPKQSVKQRLHSSFQ